jgi:nitrogen fixation protein FixH
MNWGHKITLVFIAFVGLMVFMVYQSFQVNIDLVAEDYYQQELEYLQKIDKIKNTQQLNQNISLAQENHQLIVQFSDLFERKLDGNISLFRPSAARFDVNTKITLDQNHCQSISTAEMVKGYCKVKLDWKDGDKAYYHEESIYTR